MKSARYSSTGGSGLSASAFYCPYRVEIGAYIERVVRNWDSATLVDRLELQVGKDLQYIRINNYAGRWPGRPVDLRRLAHRFAQF